MSLPSSPVVQLCLSAIAALVIWHIFKDLFGKSPLVNIPGPKVTSQLTGNAYKYFDPAQDQFRREAHAYGNVVRIQNFLGTKMLVVSDPLAMYNILLRDAVSYEEGDVFLSINRQVFGPGILATTGPQHRKQRKMLNPVFSVKHMRHMIPIFYKVSYKLREAITSRVSQGTTELDVLEWMSRLALELVGQAGLGYSFDPLTDDIVNPYTEAVKSFFPAINQLFLPMLLLPVLEKLGPAKFRRFVMHWIPWKKAQDVRNIVDVMADTCRDILDSKKSAMRKGEKAILQQVGEGKDIISILMKANQEVSEEERLDEDELSGQMSSLVFAASDTTSSALARTLYVLGQHPEAQEKLRAELTEARLIHGEMGFDELTELPYLDAVCRETLRLYAPVPLASRAAQNDTTLPLSRPMMNLHGVEITSIPIPKNTEIVLNILNVNRDPAIWGEDALEWKPERWLAPLPDTVKQANIPGVYANLMTFLGGSRSCIGFKFSQLEMKVVLSLVVESFKFELHPDKEIVWRFGRGIQTAHVKGVADNKPRLPMVVSMVSVDSSF